MGKLDYLQKYGGLSGIKPRRKSRPGGVPDLGQVNIKDDEADLRPARCLPFEGEVAELAGAEDEVDSEDELMSRALEGAAEDVAVYRALLQEKRKRKKEKQIARYTALNHREDLIAGRFRQPWKRGLSSSSSSSADDTGRAAKRRATAAPAAAGVASPSPRRGCEAGGSGDSSPPRRARNIPQSELKAKNQRGERKAMGYKWGMEDM